MSASIPSSIVFMYYDFRNTYNALAEVLWDDQLEFRRWFDARTSRVFTLRSTPAKLLVIGFLTLTLITVFLSGLPFKAGGLNVIALSGFFTLMVIGAQAAYILLDLLITLNDVTHRDPHVPFFRLPHPALSRLFNMYARSSLLTSVAYALLVIAIWQGPYGFSLQMQAWLTVLAAYPLAMFFWSFFRVHILMQKAKQSHLELINAEVVRNFNMMTASKESDMVQRLEKVMEIQSKIQSVREWPIAVQGVFAFIVTFVTLAAQIVSLARAVVP